jgi:hypothetical protein
MKVTLGSSKICLTKLVSYNVLSPDVLRLDKDGVLFNRYSFEGHTSLQFHENQHTNFGLCDGLKRLANVYDNCLIAFVCVKTPSTSLNLPDNYGR